MGLTLNMELTSLGLTLNMELYVIAYYLEHEAVRSSVLP